MPLTSTPADGKIQVSSVSSVGPDTCSQRLKEPPAVKSTGGAIPKTKKNLSRDFSSCSLTTRPGDESDDVAYDIMKAHLVTALYLKERASEKSNNALKKVNHDISFLFAASTQLESEVESLTKEKEDLQTMIDSRSFSKQLETLLEVKTECEMALNREANHVNETSSLVLFTKQPDSDVCSLVLDLTNAVLQDQDKLSNFRQTSESCLDLLNNMTEVNSVLDGCEDLQRSVQETTRQLTKYETVIKKLQSDY